MGDSNTTSFKLCDRSIWALQRNSSYRRREGRVNEVRIEANRNSRPLVGPSFIWHVRNNRRRLDVNVEIID
jgi:hypothetical protein